MVQQLRWQKCSIKICFVECCYVVQLLIKLLAVCSLHDETFKILVHCVSWLIEPFYNASDTYVQYLVILSTTMLSHSCTMGCFPRANFVPFKSSSLARENWRISAGCCTKSSWQDQSRAKDSSVRIPFNVRTVNSGTVYCSAADIASWRVQLRLSVIFRILLQSCRPNRVL